MSSGTASSVTISSKTLSSEALSSGRERTLELQVVNLQAGISSKKSEQQQNFLFEIAIPLSGDYRSNAQGGVFSHLLLQPLRTLGADACPF